MVPMRPRLLPIVLLLALAGCKSKPELHPQQPVAKPLPQGWAEASSKDNAVSIGTPSGWRNGVDKMAIDLQGMGIGEGDHANPGVQQFAQQMDAQGQAEEKQRLDEMFEKGVLLHVISTGKPVFDETRTRYIVQRYEDGGNWDFDQAAEFERKQYAFKPKRQDVTLPIGKAVKLFASEEMRNGSIMNRISFLAIDGKKLYVLRFLTQEDKSVIESIADGVAQTWRIRPSK